MVEHEDFVSDIEHVQLIVRARKRDPDVTDESLSARIAMSKAVRSISARIHDRQTHDHPRWVANADLTKRILGEEI